LAIFWLNIYHDEIQKLLRSHFKAKAIDNYDSGGGVRRHDVQQCDTGLKSLISTWRAWRVAVDLIIRVRAPIPIRVIIIGIDCIQRHNTVAPIRWKQLQSHRH